MSKETELAWLAGFYEGEGCISTHITDRKTYQDRAIHFNLTQKNPWPLYRAREILREHVDVEMPLNVTNRNFQHMKGQQRYWQLQTARPDVIEKFVDAVWDYLSPRRQMQIIEAMDAYEEAESGSSYSKSYLFRGRLQLITPNVFEGEIQEFLDNQKRG